MESFYGLKTVNYAPFNAITTPIYQPYVPQSFPPQFPSPYPTISTQPFLNYQPQPLIIQRDLNTEWNAKYQGVIGAHQRAECPVCRTKFNL